MLTNDEMVISSPDLPLSALKMFSRPMLIIVLMSESLNLPFTVDYSYLLVDLCFIEKIWKYSILWSFYAMI